MSDYSTPDLSNIRPIDLPRPNSTTRPAPSAEVGAEDAMAVIEPNALQRSRREASLHDMVTTRPDPQQGVLPVTAPADPTQRSSFATSEQIRDANQLRQAPIQQAPIQQAPFRVEAETVPAIIATAVPARQRDIRELFTFGKMRETINVAGFDLTICSLTAEEYTRAWAMASAFPEGNSRENAVRQYLLAFSVPTINNYRTEDLCQTSSLTEKVQRRADVFANMDTQLVRQFFDQGYMAVHTKTQEHLENLGKDVGAAANFTQQSQR